MEQIIEQIGILAPTIVMGLGFATGIEHAFESDHIAAVTNQISKLKTKPKSTRQLFKESFTKSSLLGAIWGAGHTTSLVFVGFLIYVLTISIQEQIFSSFEFAVGMMLVFLGVMTVFNKKMRFRHKHPHKHKDGTLHFDEHIHDDSNHGHTHKSYLIGIVHGLAGSGSLVILTSATMNSVEMILGFIVIFGLGSIVGMVLAGSLMGVPLAFANRIGFIQKVFRYVAGTFSFVLGVNIMYQLALVHGFAI